MLPATRNLRFEQDCSRTEPPALNTANHNSRNKLKTWYWITINVTQVENKTMTLTWNNYSASWGRRRKWEFVTWRLSDVAKIYEPRDPPVGFQIKTKRNKSCVVLTGNYLYLISHFRAQLILGICDLNYTFHATFSFCTFPLH